VADTVVLILLASNDPSLIRGVAVSSTSKKYFRFQVEIEHVNCDILEALELEGTPVT